MSNRICDCNAGNTEQTIIFPLKIQQTTNYRNFFYIRKIKRKSDPQRKAEPLPNLLLVVPRQKLNTNTLNDVTVKHLSVILKELYCL